MRLIEVRDPRGLTRFIDLPWRIYPGRFPAWVPPLRHERRAFLDPGRNPFFEHAEVKLFLVEDERGAGLGRIAGIVNHRHNTLHRDRTGFFGLFECTDDPAAATALFAAAADFLRQRGMTVMRGPMNLSINDEAGLLVAGFEHPPMVMMPYNPPYYEGLVTAGGFRPVMNLFAYHTEPTPEVPERVARAAARARERYEFVVRPVKLRDFDREVRRVQEVYGAAWAENWGAVAMTDREFHHLASQLREIIDPDLCFVAEVAGRIAGFSLALPDINQALRHVNGRLFPFGVLRFLWHRRRINAVRIITLGVLKEFRHLGIEACFYAETHRQARAKGLVHAEASWILENNVPMSRALVKLGFQIYKTYRVYDRALA